MLLNRLSHYIFWHSINCFCFLFRFRILCWHRKILSFVADRSIDPISPSFYCLLYGLEHRNREKKCLICVRVHVYTHSHQSQQWNWFFYRNFFTTTHWKSFPSARERFLVGWNRWVCVHVCYWTVYCFSFFSQMNYRLRCLNVLAQWEHHTRVGFSLAITDSLCLSRLSHLSPNFKILYAKWVQRHFGTAACVNVRVSPLVLLCFIVQTWNTET